MVCLAKSSQELFQINSTKRVSVLCGGYQKDHKGKENAVPDLKELSVMWAVVHVQQDRTQSSLEHEWRRERMKFYLGGNERKASGRQINSPTMQHNAWHILGPHEILWAHE